MNPSTSSQWRYVKAETLGQETIGFSGLPVRSSKAQEELGTLDGFIVDAASGRLHYVVVDSGGWFTGGRYLVPPAYTQLDAEQQVLWADVTRAAIGQYPRFDPNHFVTMSPREAWDIERQIIGVYGDDPGVVAPSEQWDRTAWRGAAQPEWWRDDYAAARRVPVEGHRTDVVPSATTTAPGYPDPRSERAQPGDVLGIERGGETTRLGDTSEDEDKRRERAEDALRDGTTTRADVEDRRR